MPQDIEFFMPFPLGVSPDARAAADRSVSWASGRALITGPQDEERIRRWDLAGLMARWSPQATGPDLDLLVDEMIAITILDDTFDGPACADPASAARVSEHFAALTYPGNTASADGPLSRAAQEVWRKVHAGASPEWARRAGEHRRWYLDACVEEARYRARRTMPSADAYAAERHKGSGYATDPAGTVL
jgi:hypothetical protein